MKRPFLAFCLLAACFCAHAQQADATLARAVNAFVDEWHDDAAHARMAYFDKIAPEGVYIGTDKHELWRRDEFKTWARRFFERKRAWSFKALRRNVYASPDKSFIWFDEILDTPNMGPCMASGVIRKTDTGFAILHYQLSMAVPNELGGQVTRLIKDFESKPGDGKR
jgi:SnoaL-like domain